MKLLRNKDLEVMGFFYRYNIHPYLECLKREDTLKNYAENEKLKVIYQEGYDIEHFLRNTAFRESNRCILCYQERLQATANIAQKGNFDYFSTTLLYSKFQKHDTIRSIGESIGDKTGVPFYYLDFRDGWKEGIEESKKQGMYRQQYCGCIYSEKERYYK